MLIVHGNNESASRSFLNKTIDKFRLSGKLIVRLEAESIDMTDLAQKLESSGLFQNDQIFILYGAFSLAASDYKTQLIQYLKTKQDSDLIIYESDTIPAPSLRAFNKTKIEVFKSSPQVFSLMDQYYPGNTVTLLKYFESALNSGDSPEFIFAMLIRHVRLLILVSSNPNSPLLPSWQKQKLLKQARLFGLPRLLQIHKQLYSIDKGIKTGINPLSYRDQIFNLFLNS